MNWRSQTQLAIKERIMLANRNKESKLLHDDLKRFLLYEPETGLFTRLVRTTGRVRVGDLAGSDHGKGYREICVGGYSYLAHRLAWFYVHGSWPDGQIDHINGIRTDNRIQNLRVVTSSENLQNRKASRGYYWNKASATWQAYIKIDGKGRHLGTFTTEAEARAAYLAAKRVLHPSSPIGFSTN